jgi:hypothetical protein
MEMVSQVKSNGKGGDDKEDEDNKKEKAYDAEEGEEMDEYERHVTECSNLGTIRVSKDEEKGHCWVTFWDGTAIKGPANQFCEEVDAFCCDFEYLLNNNSRMYLIEYDQWSFSDPVIHFLESTLEPAINCCFRKKIVTIQLLEDTNQLQLAIHK